MKKLLSFLVILLYINLNAQKREILLVATMHEVPKLLKNSYKPLFKKTLEYKPNAIFVETAMPNDSLSWAYLKNGYSKSLKDFYKYSQKVKQTFNFNKDSLDYWLTKDFDKLRATDYKKILLSFAYQCDYANYFYYKYLKNYYPNGHRKSKRNEDYELSRKLALKLKHKKIYAADDQQTNGEFHKYWYACDKDMANTKYKKSDNKLSRKLFFREIFPSLVGRYGIINNKTKHLKLLDSLSGLKFTNQKNLNCAKAVEYFNQRNMRFAKNLGLQIKNNNFEKSVLFVGASHIIGLKKELNFLFPDINVILFNEL